MTSVDAVSSKRLTLVAATLGSFVVLLESTAVGVALPAIQADLGGGLESQQWVVNAYLLTLAPCSLVVQGGPGCTPRGSRARNVAAGAIVAAMSESRISRGFTGRRRETGDPARIPPGQYLTHDFPVLSAGPTPRTTLDRWTFTIDGAVDASRAWTWEEFLALPQETPTVDIHCVTKWSKLDTGWRGVSVDTLLDGVDTAAEYLTAWCDGGYTTNFALEDLNEGKAWIVFEYEGEPLHPEHGGPARLLVPHLYFWKSAKWVRGLSLTLEDEPGFWERYGYHNHGDPWLEQRYQGD